MKHLLTGIASLIFFMVAIGSLAAQNKNSVQGDLEALTDLYNATNGESWSNNFGWLNGNPSNNWYGVEVNSEGRVIELDLYKNNLIGELPESIGNLSKLQFFSVKRNPIYSKIPASIANWVNAEIVMFSSGSDYNMPNESSYNDHYGKRYSVTPTKYYGSIPDVFNKMPNLRIFEIAWSEDLDLQPFPSTLYQHSSLEILTLTATNLIGELDDNFNLPKLRWIYIGNNHLSGNIPTTLGLSTELRHFRIHNEPRQSGINFLGYFSGPIPDSFVNLTKLERFYAGSQNLSGEIPGFVIDKWPLRGIDIRNNNFEGTVPKEFGNKDLYRFSIADNNFSGELHPNIAAGMQRVIIFNVRGNNFEGDFPNGQMVNGEWKGWRTKTRLRTVTLDHNNFSGPLPDMPEYVGDMSLYTAHNNNFTGSIPDTWEELFTPNLRDENLRRTFNNLQLRGNQLQGIIPAWFTSENFDGSGPDVKGNRWSHRDILENGVNVSSGEQHDAPQLPFGKPLEFERPLGGRLTYGYTHKVHSTDKIIWTKLNTSSGIWEQDERFNDTSILELINIEKSDYGLYRMELYNTNSPLPDWVVSEPIVIKEGQDTGSTDDKPFEDSGSSFPDAPQLHGPVDDAKDTDLTPEFIWSDIGADYYILHVSRLDPTGMSIDVMIEDTTFTPSEILGDGTIHDWRVRGIKDGEMGDWSGVRRFTTRDENLPAVAELQSPAHFAQEVDPGTDLVWEDVTADSYEIRLINKKTAEVLFTDVSATNIYTTSEALPDTSEFIWQVKSIRNNEQSAWGPRWEFSTGLYEYSVDSPSLIAPGQGAEYDNLRPVFEWSPVDADHYVIVVSKEEPSPAKTVSGLQNETVVIQDETTTTEYKPQSALEPETLYYWRVQGIKDGEEGEWSEVWEFRTADIETSVSVGDGFEKPIETTLRQNYPNPFNPSTQIEFTLSEMQEVSLKVYDIAGRHVATLVEGLIQAGKHNATFEAGHLASGIYLYRFVSETKQFTRKMSLVK